MNGLRDHLETHRKDVLALLERVILTAKLYPSSELAGAISNMARAQMLLAEELEYLGDEEGIRSREEVSPRIQETAENFSSR